jgi:hypothetical protein
VVGGSFQVILDLRWEMAPRFDSGMIYGVGDMALEEAFPGLFGITCAKDAFVGISWKFWMFQEQLMIWR